MIKSTPTRPALRYHGGKWLLAPWIISHFPPHRLYVEPYAGGAAVLLRKHRSYAEVYNDLDDEVCNLFRVLRNPTAANRLAELLELTPFARVEFDGAYDRTDDPLERARRTIVRSYMGFGTTTLRRSRTGFRAKGLRANQPPQIDWRNYPDHVEQLCDRLRGVVVENRPAIDCILHQDSRETLFYVDPPYVHTTRSAVTKTNGGSHLGNAYRFEMTDDDHRALAEVLHDVEGMVVLSGYSCDLYDCELYPDWQRYERVHQADGAQKRTEVLWLNPACSTARAAQQPRLIA
jgi:DNA adenine methylase